MPQSRDQRRDSSHAWRKTYAGSVPPEMKRLRLLEGENSRFKKLVADPSLDEAVL